MTTRPCQAGSKPSSCKNDWEGRKASKPVAPSFVASPNGSLPEGGFGPLSAFDLPLHLRRVPLGQQLTGLGFARPPELPSPEGIPPILLGQHIQMPVEGVDVGKLQ